MKLANMMSPRNNKSYHIMFGGMEAGYEPMLSLLRILGQYKANGEIDNFGYGCSPRTLIIKLNRLKKMGLDNRFYGIFISPSNYSFIDIQIYDNMASFMDFQNRQQRFSNFINAHDVDELLPLFKDYFTVDI